MECVPVAALRSAKKPSPHAVSIAAENGREAEAAKVTMAFDQDEFFACARYGELDAAEGLARTSTARAPADGAARRVCERPRSSEGITGEVLIDVANSGNTPAPRAQQKQAACLKLVLTDSLKNNFGRSALTEARVRDGACATIALEHDSAAEEKIIEGLEKVETDDAPQTITHSLKLVKTVVSGNTDADKSTDAPGDGSGATDRTGLGVWAAACTGQVARLAAK